MIQKITLAYLSLSIVSVNAMDRTIAQQTEEQARIQEVVGLGGAEAELKRAKIAETVPGQEARDKAVQSTGAFAKKRFVHWKLLNIDARPEKRGALLKMLEHDHKRLTSGDNVSLWSPLHSLMRDENVEFLHQLRVKLAGSFDPHGKDAYGDTALHVAALQGQVGCVKVLVDAGADVMSTNNEGETPLHLAACNNKAAAVVSLLLERGAAQRLDVAGCAPYFLALAHRNNDSIALLKEAKIDTECSFYKDVPTDFTAMHVCAAKNWVVGINTIARQEPESINAKIKGAGFRASSGSTALAIAAACGYVEAVRTLLSRGADKNIRDEKGKTACQVAMEKAHPGGVRITSS